MSITTSNEVTKEEESSVNSIRDTYQNVQINNNKVYTISKRAIDIICSLLGLILLMPVFFIIVALIKLEDRNGPVLFKQIRVGKDNKQFYMYKFRSMVTDAEELKESLLQQNEATGPIFKMKDDPRVTNIGKFIRRTSLDELPQLVNVLKGEMSLVGPRPPLLDEVEKYTSYERQRLSVTPGLTCYWQVSGRSNLGFEQWIELDLKYISERSLLVDSKLIVKTVFVLFGSKDAY